MVLIPKGNGDFRCFGLVELLWKVLSGIINQKIGSAVHFYDVLHSFQAGRGTGTATLEANFLQQLTAIREEILYKVFLDLLKAYDSLDR